jgi:hypothetical protein
MSTMGMMHYDFTPFGGVNEQVAALRPNGRELRVCYGLSLVPALRSALRVDGTQSWGMGG